MIDWERGAKLFNMWRVIPRVLVLGSALYFGVYIWDITEWYMNLPDRTAEVSAFVGAVTTLLGGILKFLFDTYMKTGCSDGK